MPRRSHVGAPRGSASHEEDAEHPSWIPKGRRSVVGFVRVVSIEFSSSVSIKLTLRKVIFEHRLGRCVCAPYACCYWVCAGTCVWPVGCVILVVGVVCKLLLLLLLFVVYMLLLCCVVLLLFNDVVVVVNCFGEGELGLGLKRSLGRRVWR